MNRPALILAGVALFTILAQDAVIYTDFHSRKGAPNSCLDQNGKKHQVGEVMIVGKVPLECVQENNLEGAMSKLTAKKRNALPSSDFALKGRRFPVNDRSHAANAKARATEMVNKGKLSASSAEKIRKKANAMLHG